VPGVAVVGLAERRVAWERYFGVGEAGRPEPVTAETLFEAASMTKPTAGYLALRLVQEGKLDLDRPLRAYLEKPYIEGETRHLAITARMALAHTTGLPNWRPGGWRGGGPLAPAAEPGTKYSYSGEGYTYLQTVLERIVGEPIGTHLERTVLAPCGATTARYTWQDDWGRRAAAGHLKDGEPNRNRSLYRHANTAFSLYCPAREYARFVAEMLQPDRTGPYSLGAAARAAMATPTTRIPASGEPIPRRDGSRPRASHYGLGWAIDELARDRRLRHSGANASGFRSYTEFYPDRGAGIVIMTNAVGGAELWRETIRAVGEV
jgi:CubicO group peptidase (beta-lactamase class C family)